MSPGFPSAIASLDHFPYWETCLQHARHASANDAHCILFMYLLSPGSVLCAARLGQANGPNPKLARAVPVQ